MHAATGGSNMKWGAKISNGGSPAPLPPAGDGPGASGAQPPFKICIPHFMFGPPVAVYIQNCI